MQTFKRAQPALLCVLLGLLFAWTPQAHAAPAPDAKTPEELFKQVQNCYDSKTKVMNIGALMALSTKDSKYLMTPLVVMIAGFATMKNKELEEKVKGILKEHGFKKAKDRGPGFRAPIDKRLAHSKKALAGVTKMDVLLNKLGKVIVQAELAKKKRRPDRQPLSLKDLKITGDTAFGIMVMKRPGKEGKELTEPFFFRKEGKGWKIDFVAIEKDKEAKRKARKGKGPK